MPIEDIIVNLKQQDDLTAPFKRTISQLQNQLAQLKRPLTKLNEEVRKLNNVQLLGNMRTKKVIAEMNKTFMDTASISQVNKNAIQDLFTGVTPRVAGFFQVLSMGHEDWVKFNKDGRKFERTSARMANWLRKVTHGFRGFKMEMLSVMFFGMGMKRFFTGLITPALEMVGIFDVFRTALQLLFLPIALKVLDWALMFLDWVNNISESQQKWINVLAGAGVVLGALLQIIGVVVLGLGGLILFLSPIIALFLSLGRTIFEMLPWWGDLVAGASLLGISFDFINWVNDAFRSLIGIVKELVNEFIRWEPVQDFLKEFGIEADTFGEVWVKIKDKIKTALGDSWRTIHDKIFQISMFISLKWQQITAKFDKVIKKITGKDGLTDNFKKMAKTLNNLNIETGIKVLNTLLDVLVNIFDIYKKIKDFSYATSVPLYDVGYLREKTANKGGYTGSWGSPSNTINFSPNITVNATSDVDIENLKYQLSEELRNEIDNLRRQ
ncbi:MAG: hypothetical protein ACTSX6_04840 [Candidatus Heimdallarchaeaceae archaeon]